MLFGRGESPYQASTASLPLVQVRGFEKCQTIVTYTNGEKMAELKITPCCTLASSAFVLETCLDYSAKL